MLGLCVDESMPWRAIDKLDADPELNPPMLSVNDFGNLAGVNPVMKNKNKFYLLNMYVFYLIVCVLLYILYCIMYPYTFCNKMPH